MVFGARGLRALPFAKLRPTDWAASPWPPIRVKIKINRRGRRLRQIIINPPSAGGHSHRVIKHDVATHGYSTNLESGSVRVILHNLRNSRAWGRKESVACRYGNSVRTR